MNLKVIWILSCFTFFILVFFLWSRKIEEKVSYIDNKKEIPMSLIQEVINGKPTYTGLLLSFDKNKYYNLSAKESTIYKPKMFGDFISVGDSICKKAANDTIIVYKKGVSYIWLLRND